VCARADKHAPRSTILPAISAEPRYALVNGHQTLPSNVTSSSRDLCNGEVARSCNGYRSEPVSTSTVAHEDLRQVVVFQYPPTTQSECLRQQHQQLLHDPDISSHSTPSCVFNKQLSVVSILTLFDGYNTCLFHELPSQTHKILILGTSHVCANSRRT